MNTNQKKYKFTATQTIRVILQIVFFVFLPTLYYNVFNGIKQIVLAIANQSFNTALIPQLIEAIAIIPLTILLGRFFCGWMCAFGSFGDLMHLLGKKVFKINFKMDPKADRVLKYFKYAWLIVLLAVWWLGLSIFSKMNPWDAFGMIATVGKMPAIPYVAANLTIGFVIFAFITLGSFFIERLFCRYFCPLGAVFAIFSKLRITRIEKPTEKCGKCRICTNSCAMGIELYKKDRISSGECIHCMKCVSACPRHNVALTVSGDDVKPLVAGTIAAAAMTGIYYAGSLSTQMLNVAAAATTTSITTSATLGSSSSASSDSSTVSDASGSTSAASSASSGASSAASSAATSSAAASASSLKYKDGTYQGSGTGFRGATTTVSVTISGGKITDIKTVSYGDDGPFYSRAFSTVTQSIVNQQSAQVNAVSGATYSSNGIMSAVANALSKAK